MLIKQIKIIFLLYFFNQIAYSADKCQIYDNGICIKCQKQQYTLETNCNCESGFYYDNIEKKCIQCNELCKTCINSEQCTSCLQQEGLMLNIFENKCECIQAYYLTDNKEQYCKKMFIYGIKEVQACPPNTIANTQSMTCQQKSNLLMENDSKLQLILGSVYVMIIQIMIGVLIYLFLDMKLFYYYEQQRLIKVPLSEQGEIVFKKQVQLEQTIFQKKIDDQNKKIKEELDQKYDTEDVKNQKELINILQKKIDEKKEKEQVQIEKYNQIKELQEQQINKINEDQKKQNRQIDYYQELVMQRKKRYLQWDLWEQFLRWKKNKRIERKNERERKLQIYYDLLWEMREKRQNYQNTAVNIDIKCKEDQTKYKSYYHDIEILKLQNYDYLQLVRKLRLRIKELQLKNFGLQQQKNNLFSILNWDDYEATLLKIEELTREDLIFMQNLNHPPLIIKLCLECVIFILTKNKKRLSWEEVRLEFCYQYAIRQRILAIDPLQFSLECVEYIKQTYVIYKEWNYETVENASQVAAVLYCWIMQLLKFAQQMHELKNLDNIQSELKGIENQLKPDLDEIENMEKMILDYERHINDNHLKIKKIRKKQEVLLEREKTAISNIETLNKKIERLKTEDFDKVSELSEDSYSEEGYYYKYLDSIYKDRDDNFFLLETNEDIYYEQKTYQK